MSQRSGNRTSCVISLRHLLARAPVEEAEDVYRREAKQAKHAALAHPTPPAGRSGRHLRGSPPEQHAAFEVV